MTDTPGEPEPGTDVDLQETPVDGSLTLALLTTLSLKDCSATLSLEEAAAALKYDELLAEATRYFYEQEWRRADKVCREAIALRHDRPAAYYDLGAVLKTSGHLLEAAQRFLEAKERSPVGSEHWALATAYAFEMAKECDEMAKPEWWNDEGLKALSARVVRAAPNKAITNFMRAIVLHGICGAWEAAPRSPAELRGAAAHYDRAAALDNAPMFKAQAVSLADQCRSQAEATGDVGLALAELPIELLFLVAVMLGNPLGLLISNAHLSKAFCETARAAAQGFIWRVELLEERKRTVGDAVVATMVSQCKQLRSLYLGAYVAWSTGDATITDAALVALASGCAQLEGLVLCGCIHITDAGVAAVAKGCTKLEKLILEKCSKITDVAMTAVASECKNLTALDLSDCVKITDAGVEAVAKKCTMLASLELHRCDSITDAALEAVAKGCAKLTVLKLCHSSNFTNEGVVSIASGCAQLTSLNLSCCPKITDAAVDAVLSGRACSQLTSLGLAGCDNITDEADDQIPNTIRRLNDYEPL